ncbi:MAG: ATP-binding protein [Bryobacterales bacterium]|nr:ATP-binding protein [Bryobacterales bacterium]
MQLRTGCLSLHDGVVPSRLFGLGTRRILAVALHSMITDAPAILLIDEFEHGPEPHRIRRLLRQLAAMNGLQVIMTTHSPVVVHEIASEALTVIRASDQEVTAQTVPTHELQKPSAKRGKPAGTTDSRLRRSHGSRHHPIPRRPLGSRRHPHGLHRSPRH